MRQTKMLGTLVAAVLLAACGSSSDSNPPPYTGFARPAGAIAVNFKVDDTANKVYEAGDLQWKGAMIYNSNTRLITADSTWGGPWATLTDDGPWTVSTTAHEPSTATAGDHIWGVTVFVVPPATGTKTYEYGLNDAYYQTQFNNGWIWVGSNGTFTVNAGQTTDIDAPGLTIPAFGDRDVRLTIDTAALDPTFAWSTDHVRVKTSATAWGTTDITANKAGSVYTFTLSDVIGAGKPFKHSGKVHRGEAVEFNFLFDAIFTGSMTTSCCDSGCGNPNGYPCEYKVSGTAQSAGVTAFYQLPTDPTYVTTTIGLKAGGMGGQNTYFRMP